MTRAIFLDFDGVLHPSVLALDLPDVRGGKHSMVIEQRQLFRWTGQLAEALEKHGDVMLFVHSSWREHLDNPAMREVLGPARRWFDGVTPKGMTRYAGILAMVERVGIDKYLILDDATHEFPADCQELLATDPATGLLDPLVQIRLARWLEDTFPAFTE